MHRIKPAKQPEATAENREEVAEGKARLRLPVRTESKPRVFYNPKMELNRDIAILFVSSHFPSSRQLRICDPMTASGVRAIRYLLETQNVTSVLASDNKPETVEAARTMVSLNGLADRISIVESDANVALANHATERFDLVDLDPFGSPAPFFENALRATLDGGVIAATATDMGPLTGARASACVRKYGIRPVRSEFEKEMAVRILSACICVTAGRLELGIEIAFSHATDHYARIYAKVTKGRPSANLSTKSIGFLEYCPNCLRRVTHHNLESIASSCPDCRGKPRIGGPIWLGPIWNPHTVKNMIEHAPYLRSSRLTEVQYILATVREECEAPAFHYRTDMFSSRLALKPPAVNGLLDTLRESGYQATRTHFSRTGFRTNAPSREIGSVFRQLADEI